MGASASGKSPLVLTGFISYLENKLGTNKLFARTYVPSKNPFRWRWLEVCCDRLRNHPAFIEPSQVFSDPKNTKLATQQKPAKSVKSIGVWVEKSTLNTYFLSGCAASSGEGVPIWLIVAII